MATAFNTRKRIRRFFGHIESVAPMPNLIEVQKSSYEGFLQRMIPAAKRSQSGLQEVFRGVFPIKDFAERASLEFVKYEFEEPKYDVEECQQRGITYAAPLKVTLQLVVWDIDEEAGSRSIRPRRKACRPRRSSPPSTARSSISATRKAGTPRSTPSR